MREQEAAGQQQGGREQQGSGGSHQREAAAAAAAAAAASGAFTVPAALPATPWRKPKGISRPQYEEKQKGAGCCCLGIVNVGIGSAVPGGGSCMLRWQGGSGGEGRAL